MLVRADQLEPGMIGPWGSMVLKVRPSHYDRRRVIVSWTGGEGPGLRGASPNDVRCTAMQRDRAIRIEGNTDAP